MLNGLAYCRMEFAEGRPQDFTYLAVNPAFERLTGLTGVVGKKVSAVIPGIRESAPDLFEAYARVSMTGVPEKIETWVEPLSMWFDISIYSPRRKHFVAVFDVITERKRAEDALRQTLSLNLSLTQHLPHRVFAKDRNLRYTFSNANYARDLGIDAKTIVGMDDFAFYPKELADAYRADDLEVMTTGREQFFDEPYTVAGGERWIHTAKIPHRDEQGEIIGVLGLFEDITERKRAEETNRLQGAALQATADAVVITDREGTIVWANPAFTRMTGYAADEALGKNPRDLVRSEKQSPAVFKDLWDTILDGRTWQGQLTNRRKDGTTYPEYQTVTPIFDATGAITHFVAIKRDISAQLQLEAEFRQAQKMEGVGQLTSGIAHDFNNLLTVINGTAELLLEEINAADPVHKDVEEIHKAGERGAKLTRQLLAFSRQQILAPQALSISALVTGMEGLLKRMLGEDIDLVTVPSSDVAYVNADAGQLEQVLVNLAVNARDAMPHGGRLTIATENVASEVAIADESGVAVPPGAYVRLAVGDSGVGMDEATRVRVFEPFFTTKEPGKGTGLGLSTVFGIVKQSQGFVRIASEPGEGTSVTIYLPQVIGAAATAQPAPAKRASAGTETILVVDDDDGLRRLSTRVLEAAGYTVVGVATGEAALEVLAQRDAPVHLMLTDVVMPGMGGRHLGERLAETSPGVKVIYMSGYTSDAVVRNGIQEAQVPFLQKPFTPSALLKKVRDVLDTKG